MSDPVTTGPTGRRRDGTGKLVMIVGLALLPIAAIVVLAIVIVAINDGASSVFELDAGECFVLPIDGDDTSLEQVETVSCTEPHDAEVVLSGQLNATQDREYPAEDQLFAELDQRCATVPIPERFGMLPIAPNQDAWRPLGGRFLCLAVPYGAELIEQPIADF